MKQYIGKDITEVMVESGRPVNAFDMPDGTRAFQFYIGGGTVDIPTTTNQHGTVNVIGNTAFVNSTTTTNPGGTYSSPGCLITYFAREKSKGAWIVEGISYPDRLFC